MVNVRIRIRDKWANTKKVFVIVGIVILILVILGGMFMFGFFSGGKTEIILTNPLKNIVVANTNEAGEVDVAAVLTQGILEFDENYINYLLVAVGVGNLHRSLLYGNPFIEFNLDEETWSSELIKGALNTKKQIIDNEDLRITISKEKAVKALLSQNIEQFMKDSVANGETQIEMISGKTELFSKGYLNMYKELTREDIEIE